MFIDFDYQNFNIILGNSGLVIGHFHWEHLWRWVTFSNVCNCTWLVDDSFCCHICSDNGYICFGQK